uniref:TYRAAT2-like C-terminal domain-containing protein n=1 Tax=Pyramimonas obovata TaxID=1411642 RepID=A0A7S0WSM1_9CHLO
MVEMSCEEHDRLAASSQFITHTVGRVLGELDLESTPIDTKGYQSLLALKGNTEKDSFDLYYGLFMYNQNATDELNRLEEAFDDIKRQLFARLHQIVRDDLFSFDEVFNNENLGGFPPKELPAATPPPEKPTNPTPPPAAATTNGSAAAKKKDGGWA